MHRALLPLLLLTSGCVRTITGQDGTIYVVVVDDYTLESKFDCTENFVDFLCEDEVDVEEPDGPVITTETDQSGPSFNIILLDQGHDCPILVIDETPVFGQFTENGMRYTWTGFETNTRNVDDPSGFTSDYTETIRDEWTLRLTETEEDGIYNWNLTETYSFNETASYTDEVDAASLQFPAPDTFFWPVNGIVYTGTGYFPFWSPDADDCDGVDCMVNVTRSVVIDASGQAKFATLLSLTDDVGPFDWSNGSGVGEEPTFQLGVSLGF